MDQNTVTELVKPNNAHPGADWQEGDAWIAGGTFLLSLPLPHIKRFRDISSLGWASIVETEDGLEIGATCTVAELHAYQPPTEWQAGPLIEDCVQAFLSSFKVWNGQTVGGNICTSIPAGPMTTLACALDADLYLIATDNTERVVPAIDFVTGNNQNILQPGELLRKIVFSRAAFDRRYALRRFSLTKAGRSSIFLVGTRDPQSDEVVITITAATIHPVHLRFAGIPTSAEIASALSSIPDDVYFDDPNGTPEHRRHLTELYTYELIEELSDGKSR